MTARAPTLGVVVCANGRGHRLRVERVVSALRDRMPALEVIAHEEDAVLWSRDAALYDDGRLLAWHERAMTLEALRADVVLSDNLPAVLRARPDAILMGSFLWSDVLSRAYPGSAAVRVFADAEDALLERHRPDMICLEDFVMPAVRERTNARGVGIIGRRPRDERTPARGADGCIVFARGGTGAADALCAPLKERAAARASCVWREDVDAIGNAVAVVGRPGIGTITECIEERVPLLCVVEDNSPEMEHNAARVEALGLGALLRPGQDVLPALDALRARRAEITATAARMRLDGAARAAEIVRTRFKEGNAA